MEILLIVSGLAACGTSGGMQGDDGSGGCPDLAGGASTLSGGAEAGYMDGVRCTALFHNPVSVAYGPDGKVYVADFDNGKIRVDRRAGQHRHDRRRAGLLAAVRARVRWLDALRRDRQRSEQPARRDVGLEIWKVDVNAKTATPLAVDIGRPRALFMLKDGRLAATDYENHVVEAINVSTGAVTNIAGTFGEKGFADGAGAAARFASPYGVVQRADGSLVVADWENQRIRIVGLDGTVSTMAGGSAGFVDGAMADAKFNHPQGMAIDSSDNIYFTDLENFRVRKSAARAS